MLQHHFVVLFSVILCFGNDFDLKELYEDDSTPSYNEALPIEVIPAILKIIEYKASGELVRDSGRNIQNTYELGKGSPFADIHQRRQNEIIIPMNKQILTAKRNKQYSIVIELENELRDKIREFNIRNNVARHFIDHRRDNMKTGTKTQYWMEYDSKTLYIYFIGTDNINDWKSNLDLDKITIIFNEKPIIIHKGFYNHIKKAFIHHLIMDLYHVLITLDKEVEYVRICGHSMGAVLAQIFFLSLLDIELMKELYLNDITEISEKQIGIHKINEIQSSLPIATVSDKYMRYLVVTLGSPVFIYFKSIENIDKLIQNRIINIITAKDPIPMIFGGRYDNDKSVERFTTFDTFKQIFGSPAIAVDQSIGKYYVIWGAPIKDKTGNYFHFKIKSLNGDKFEQHICNGYHLLANQGSKLLPKIIKFAKNVVKYWKSYHSPQNYQFILSSVKFMQLKYPKQLIGIDEWKQLLALNENERNDYYNKYYNDKTDTEAQKELSDIKSFITKTLKEEDTTDTTDSIIFTMKYMFICIVIGIFIGAFRRCFILKQKRESCNDDL